MEYKDRLRAARKHAKLTQPELAAIVKITQTTVSELETGKSLSSSHTASIAAACGVNAVWLERGIGEMLEKANEDGSPSEKDYALIPQYTAVGGCGDGYLNEHAEVKGGLAFKRDWLAKMKVKPENLCAIYATGASMEPWIMEGDVVLFDQSDTTPRDRQPYAIRRPDGEVSIKRLVLGITGGWIIRSDNPNKSEYPDEMLSANAVHEVPIIGRVIWRGGGIL